MIRHEMVAQQNVNNSDCDPTGHCGTCGHNTYMENTIQCQECQIWIHFTYSALPLYLLLCLARTNRRYTCEKCTYVKYADPEWVKKVSEVMDKMRKEQIPYQACDILASTDIGENECTEITNGIIGDTNIETSTTRDVDLGNTPEDTNFSQLPSTPQNP
ncbi:hypothetical protein E2C01_053834 [Portunus trituberculatus]|uniref:Uncharacterized protein n=1 Tax=Portunus trituberculatus TaxID=210409 RepID=A0A5B7GQF4_PORTR|nr:hypothetical protein [Portunus trituberculatus]